MIAVCPCMHIWHCMHFWVYLILNYHSVLNIVQFRLTGCMAVNLQYKSSLAGDAVKHAGIILVHK